MAEDVLQIEEAYKARLATLEQNLAHAKENEQLIRESIAELELVLEDVGWLRMSGTGDREFSVAGLRRLRRYARLSYLKNPLIRHGVEVQTHYVWGQGCS